jgi:shikimate dehydrogenase
MKHFAVIGHPIGHSLSPLMHNTSFQLLGLDCQYQALDIDPISLKERTEQFREQMWGGFNVTTPHKEAIIPLLDEVVPEARAVGAVNTVVNSTKGLIGYNTDVIGIERSLRSHKTNIEGHACTIMGSGGAARSVAHVLTHIFKAKTITFAALYPEQAYAIIESIGRTNVVFHVLPFTDENLEIAITGCTLLVNATTVGMFPLVLDCPVPNHQWLTHRHIVFDLIYRPLQTRLLQQAQSVGAKTIDGLGMFIQQGAAAFHLWTGKDMPIDQARQVLEKKLTSDET